MVLKGRLPLSSACCERGRRDEPDPPRRLILRRYDGPGEVLIGDELAPARLRSCSNWFLPGNRLLANPEPDEADEADEQAASDGP